MWPLVVFMEYLFIFGRDSKLSIVELFSYLDARKIDFKVKKEFESAIVLEIDNFNPKKAIEELGGTVKICEVLDEIKMEKLYKGKSTKIKYGISNYTNEDIEELKEYIKILLKKESLKATLKKTHRKELWLMPSEVIKYGLLDNGFEIVVYHDVISKTVAVFNPGKQEERDLKRPRKRPLLSISIRLAKILINLSGATKGQKLLDPFCGYGILLQEALLMGIDVVGLDIDKKCVSATRENLEWLKKRYGAKGNFELYCGDCRKLSEILKEKVDAIATEPYLGPLLRGKISVKEARLRIEKLRKLYADFLNEARKVLKEGKRLVIITPVFKVGKEEFRVDLKKYTVYKLAKFKGIVNPIRYKAPGGKLEREIWVLINSKNSHF